ncbi:hypothetical protein F503_06680 [Ophiostoma piceae UAMH 11346]|uniref:Uncharacterized protein n=1 Tax=Ophiostoma piceae (strain UAMH 11346) TaxID=1262450 RepID=S3BSR5_OPHP1|nr:hypothetical protein F503_06680 [Ophiostoma piceae UAMH 11346]
MSPQDQEAPEQTEPLAELSAESRLEKKRREWTTELIPTLKEKRETYPVGHPQRANYDILIAYFEAGNLVPFEVHTIVDGVMIKCPVGDQVIGKKWRLHVPTQLMAQKAESGTLPGSRMHMLKCLICLLDEDGTKMDPTEVAIGHDTGSTMQMILASDLAASCLTHCGRYRHSSMGHHLYFATAPENAMLYVAAKKNGVVTMLPTMWADVRTKF